MFYLKKGDQSSSQKESPKDSCIVPIRGACEGEEATNRNIPTPPQVHNNYLSSQEVDRCISKDERQQEDNQSSEKCNSSKVLDSEELEPTSHVELENDSYYTYCTSTNRFSQTDDCLQATVPHNHANCSRYSRTHNNEIDQQEKRHDIGYFSEDDDDDDYDGDYIGGCDSMNLNCNKMHGRNCEFCIFAKGMPRYPHIPRDRAGGDAGGRAGTPGSRAGI